MSGFALALVGALSIGAAIAAAVLSIGEVVSAPPQQLTPVATRSPVEQDGPWERIEVAPAFAVQDLRATSFGLVAAAGDDGIWISEDGVAWRQSLALFAPLPATAGTGTTVVGDSVMGAVKAVAEFDSTLYAFGSISRETASDSRAWLVAWRSADGDTWERIDIAEGWDQIMDVTTGAEGITLFVRASRQLPTGSECCFAALYRSSDGDTWEELTAELSGLENVQLWSATSFEEGYLAIGSSGDGDTVFSSTDGLTWQAAATWRDAAPAMWRSLDLHDGAWSIVDLFEGPDGVTAVVYSEMRDGLVLLTSSDGIEFNVFEDSNSLLLFKDDRADAWPPLTAPEGAAHNGQLMLLGEWYPDSEDEPCTHLWRWTPGVSEIADEVWPAGIR